MSAEVIRLRDRYEIRFDQPVAAVAPTGTTAYGARDIRSPGPPLIAVVPDLQLPPRVSAATAIRSMRQPALWTPADWGVVDCPPLGRRSWVVVGDFPDGGRLVAETDGKFPAWDETDLKQKLLQPLLPGLKALATDGIAHRAIHLGNIWYRDQQRRIVMLGEGVVSPAALHQPFVYEPIESALAHPLGRGDGRTADDLYALGVLIVHLLLGELPCGAVPDNELLDRKLTQGSLATLTSTLRLSASLTDLCRGLLADHPLDRWGVDEIASWLEGRRLPFKPPNLEPTATRPFLIGGVQCMTARGVARVIAGEGEKAIEAVHDKNMQTWLHRALPGTKTKDRVLRALADGEEGDPGSRGVRLVARVAIALDPAAPVRYRGLATYPDGLGTILAWASFTTDGAPSVKLVAEIIRGRLIQFWTSCQPDSQIEYDIWSRDHDRLRLFVVDHRPGQGIERALYELSPRLHCLSPAIEAAQVTTIEELLPALERAAEQNRIGTNPIDRHTAAFIASRSRVWTDSIGTLLAHASAADRLLGVLSLLGRIQQDYGPGRLRALSALLRPQVAPLINRFHSRTARRQLLNAADDAAASGKLLALLQIIDNPEERSQDEQQFARAVARCAEARNIIRRCARDLEAVPEQGVATAQATAVVVASISGAVIVALMFLSAWTN